jgi:phospholipid/cholesterol/gamma-HCH transport system substrate-binding protein
MKFSPAVKVGILTIVALTVLIFGILWLKGRAISGGKRVEVIFQDVDGMRPGSAVQIMGLRIGQVEEVTPFITTDKSFVKVKFVITEPDIEIPTASEISIQQSGIIGEKFIEITPPKTQYVYLSASAKENLNLHEDNNVELPIEGTYLNVGKIKAVELVNTRTLPLPVQQDIDSSYAYKIGYIITTPGLQAPEKLKPSVIKDTSEKNKNKLRLTPPIYYMVQMPEISSPYTIVEPIRLKEFFDLQLKSAKSLNETNNKINTILSEEAILDLKYTLKNIKTLSEKANGTLDQANLLMATSKKEIDTIVTLADRLSTKVATLTDNVNSIIANPEFKTSLISTTKSINESTKRLSDLLKDEKTKQTLLYVNETAKNLSELSGYINSVSKDKDVQKRIVNTVDNLNTSLIELSASLKKVENITGPDETKIKSILDDTADISKNLKEFSEKLNKRFLLLRLIF